MENFLELLKGSGRANDQKSDFKAVNCEILSLGVPKEFKAKNGQTYSRTALRIKGHDDETFYTFSDSIINAPEYIHPENGCKATLLIKANNWTDDEGTEHKGYEIKRCTFDVTKGLTDNDLAKLGKFGIALSVS